MKRPVLAVPAILAFIALSACGETSQSTLSGYDTQFDGIADGFISSGYGLTAPANIPATSQATYQGVATFDTTLGAREDYAGRMVVNADYDAPFGGAFSGGIDQIVDSRDRPVSGSLDVTLGGIDRFVDPVFNDNVIIDLDGNLVDADGVILAVSARADGAFVGPQAQGIIGTIDGDMLSGAYGSEGLSGAYAVER